MQIHTSITLSEILPNHTRKISHSNDTPHNDLYSASTMPEIPEIDATKNKELDCSIACQLSGVINTDMLAEYLTNAGDVRLQIGVDEAGRGPLLGSVVVAGVILPPTLSGELEQMDLTNTPLAKLNDSKKISEKKRDALYQIIPSVAFGYVSVNVPAQMIDEINILQASLQGMRIAVNELLKSLAGALVDKKQLAQVALLFDGNKLPPFTEADKKNWQDWGYDSDKVVAQAVVKGDSKFASIASASVIAKVERDEQMYELAKRYPDFGIDSHKGYPTKVHLQALEQFGVLDEHRRSFSPVRSTLDKAR